MTKIKPKTNKDYFPVDYLNMVSKPCSRKETRDNSMWAKNSKHNNCNHNWTIRIPSIKKSNKVWRNFYKLYPSMYFLMRDNVSTEKDNDVVICRDNLGSTKNAYRTVKMKVLNLDDELMMVKTTAYCGLVCRGYINEDTLNEGINNRDIIKIKDKPI